MDSTKASYIKGVIFLAVAAIAKHFGVLDGSFVLMGAMLATAYVNQERFGVEFEDRINRLVNTDPSETPAYSMLAKRECYQNQVDFQEERLDTGNADNAAIEGADVTNAAGDYSSPSGLFNYTQIPQRAFGASFTSNRVRKPGIGAGDMSMFNHEKARKLKVLKIDRELAMLSANARVQPLPESSQAGKLRGMRAWMTTNVVDAGNAQQWGDGTLSRKIFDFLAKSCVDNGGRPETVMANSTQRLKINEFVGGPTRDVDSTGRKIVFMIDQILSIAGMQDIVYNRHLAQDVILMLEMKYWEMDWLREPRSYMKGLAGSRVDGWVEDEGTLVCYSEKTSGFAKNLRTTI